MNFRINALSAFVSAVVLVQSALVLAAPAPLAVSAKFDLSAKTNRPFFELMSAPGTGIKAKLDADYGKPVVITDAVTFRKKASNFAHIAELEAKIKGGAAGLDKLVASLAGKQVPVNRMYATVIGAADKGGFFKNPSDARGNSRVVGALVPIIGLASGKGVLVQLDSQTYCYNFGYAVGRGAPKTRDQDDADRLANAEDRKSGRSYGASVGRAAYDPSDNDYLRDLGEYVAKADEKELTRFYQTVLGLLLKSDTSGIKTLSKPGQSVVADFFAVYMAELDRHLMTGLTAYEWENALTEITMIAAFSANDDGATLDSRGGSSNDEARGIVPTKVIPQIRERLTGYFGVGTDGSGLDGKNKGRRHGVTEAVTREARKDNAAMVGKIDALIGKPASRDVYNDVMEFINSFRAQATVKKNADQLIGALVDFLISTRNSAKDLSVI